jgi:heme A synthase
LLGEFHGLHPSMKGPTQSRRRKRGIPGRSRPEGNMAAVESGGVHPQPGRAMGWLRGVSILTAVSVFALVVLGGVVRVTESGLGCPDWPLCYGKLLPPLEMTAIIEYAHRLMASAIVSPLVIATCALAWVARRHEGWLVVPATLAIVFLLGQAILGGITVIQELPGFLVLAHLALGQALLACMILVAVVACRGTLTLKREGGGGSDKFPRLALVSAAGVYIVMLSGSLVTATGATPACVTWPLCQGDFMPEHPLAAIHMGHRYVAAIIGLFLLYTLHVGIRGRHRPPAVRYLSMLALGLFMAQILVGWFTVLAGFSAELRALHLAMATAVWAAVTVLAVTSLARADDGLVPPEAPGLNGGEELAHG